MAINQLFKIKPPKELVIKIIAQININLNDIDKDNKDCKKYFTIAELKEIKILEKIDVFIEKLKDYYLPCKQKIYLSNITIKKLLTIFRQLLKLYNYKIVSNDKYNNGKKYIIYKIVYIENSNSKKNINCVISFD